MFWTSSLLALLSIKPTASPQDKIFSLLNNQLRLFHRLWNRCPATAQIFNNLLQAPKIQIWLKSFRALVEDKVFSGPLWFGWESEQVPDCTLPKKAAEVSGSRLPPVLQYENSPARTSRTTVPRCAVSTLCGSYTRKASRTMTKIILSSLRVLAPLKKDCSGSHDNT